MWKKLMSEDNFLVRGYKIILYFVLKYIKNLIPATYQLNFVLHSWEKSLRINFFKYCNAEDYFNKYAQKPVNFYEIPIGKIYVINDLFCNICNRTSVTYTKDKRIILETLRNKSIIEEKVKLKTSGAIYIDEAINLALCWNDNYWHFQFLVLDKIFAMENNGFKGKYLVFNRKYIHEFMNLMQIPSDRVVYVNNRDIYQVGKMHIIENYSNTNVEMLINCKNKILNNINFSDTEKYPKRIYIRRIGNYSRKVINEEEITTLLKKYGFTLLYPDEHSVEEQIKYFNLADIIITPHGGCSTNALYMKPDSHFVECFSYTWLNPCILDIIKPNNICYHMVVESQMEGNFLSKMKRISRDYKIDPIILDSILYKICEANNKKKTHL